MTIEPTPELIAHVYLDTCTGQHFVTSEKIEKRTLHEYIGQVTIKPEEVTNPKPELPSEPGWYLDKDNFVWTLDEAGWSLNAHEYAPYTRLVPEKPSVTADEIFNLIDGGVTGPTYTTACEIADYINNR